MADSDINNASSEININELLCFLLNNFSKVPKVKIINVISNFYDVDEIVSAKKVLFHFADSLPMNDSQPLPRLISRKVGDNKRRLDVEDVYNLLFQLDQLKVALPRFVA